METERKIVRADVGRLPAALFDPMPVVRVTYDDGVTEDLYEYYPDEIRFTEAELVGLTRSEAVSLKQQKDRAYLRS